jgi:hypothetical protein
MDLKTIKKDFPYHQDKDDDFYITELSKSHQYCNVHKFDFSNTNISYDAIVALWKSDLIGYHVSISDGVYEYDKLVSVVTIEIQNSKAIEQYHTLKRKHTKNDY